MSIVFLTVETVVGRRRLLHLHLDRVVGGRGRVQGGGGGVGKSVV